MKTTTTIIAALAICMMAAGARAQENGTLVKPNLPKNELKVSFGLWPMNQTMELFSYDGDETPLKYHVNGYDKYAGVHWETHVIGSFSVTYKINFSDKWTLVFNGTMSRKTRDFWYNNGVYDKTCEYFYFYPQTGLQYNYINKDNFSLYSSFSNGIGIVVRRVVNESGIFIDPALSFHITFIGMSIGKNHCADIELGLGTQGLLNIGYSRKF